MRTTTERAYTGETSRLDPIDVYTPPASYTRPPLTESQRMTLGIALIVGAILYFAVRGPAPGAPAPGYVGPPPAPQSIVIQDSYNRTDVCVFCIGR